MARASSRSRTARRPTLRRSFRLLGLLFVVGLAVVLGLPNVAPSDHPAPAPSAPFAFRPLGPVVPASNPAGGLLFDVFNPGLAPTGTFDQLLRVNSSQWAALINSNWSNAGVYYVQNGTPVNLWIESNASNSSVDTVLWLRLFSIPALSSVPLVLVFQPKGAFLLNGSGYTGENPLLSARYGEFDNGARVFNFYDNFSGTTLNNRWSVSGYWTSSVNDGFVTNGASGNGAYISSNAVFDYPAEVDFYGNLFQAAWAISSYGEGIGTSACSTCSNAESIGWGAKNATSAGPSPSVLVNTSGTFGHSAFSTQEYATFSTVAVDSAYASFLVNGTPYESLSTSLPASPQPVGLAMHGYSPGGFTNLESTYWIRERTPVSTNVSSFRSTGPLSAYLTAYPGTLPVNQSLTLVTTTAGWAIASYSYAGLPNGCASVDLPSLSCIVRQAGQYTVTVTVRDTIQQVVSARTNLTVTGGPGPLTATLVDLPASLEVNQTLTLLTGAAGGTAPYSYGYSALPSGCSSVNRSVVSCRPSAPGTFQPQVTVRDTTGRSAVAETNVTVLPASLPPVSPLIVRLTSLSGTNFTLQPLVVLTSVTGGVAPYSYTYAGLPGGCSTSNTSSLWCVPTDVGAFTIVVRVTDFSGDPVTAWTNVTLVAAPPAGSNTTRVELSWIQLDGLVALAVVALLLAAFALLRPPTRWEARRFERKP